MRKKLSIALLAFSLAMLCANFIVRRIGSFLPSPQQEMEEEEKDFLPFGLHKQQDNTEYASEDITDSTDFIVKHHTEQVYAQEKELIKPILKAELTKEEKQTVETYAQNPKMQAFIREISAAVPEEELDQENYLQIVYKPEVRDIFMKYSQDEDFRKMAAEIMKNKDLLQLAEKTINNSEVKK